MPGARWYGRGQATSSTCAGSTARSAAWSSSARTNTSRTCSHYTGLWLFAFFFLLGLIVVDAATAEQWIGAPPHYSAVLPGVPAALLRNAALLAGFGSMYFAVTSMIETEHRHRFFAPILEEVERTLAVRAAYLAPRDAAPGAAEPR